MLPRERRNGGSVASRVAATAFGLGRFGGGFITVPGGQHRCFPIPLTQKLLLQCCPVHAGSSSRELGAEKTNSVNDCVRLDVNLRADGKNQPLLPTAAGARSGRWPHALGRGAQGCEAPAEQGGSPGEAAPRGGGKRDGESRGSPAAPALCPQQCLSIAQRAGGLRLERGLPQALCPG